MHQVAFILSIILTIMTLFVLIRVTQVKKKSNWSRSSPWFGRVKWYAVGLITVRIAVLVYQGLGIYVQGFYGTAALVT